MKTFCSHMQNSPVHIRRGELTIELSYHTINEVLHSNQKPIKKKISKAHSGIFEVSTMCANGKCTKCFTANCNHGCHISGR